MSYMLAFEDVYGGYGRTPVLRGLTFQVAKGQVYGIIGPNGSGKTTLLNAIVGLIQIDEGVIRLDGREITHLTPDQRCRMGIGRTFQIPRPFSRMTVFENVLAAAVFGARMSEGEGRKAAAFALETTGLGELRGKPAGSLSLLDRKRLEIARAIGTAPRLLLLDEVAAGLTSAETEEVVSLVGRLRASGYTIIWIEHIVDAMMKAADQMMCLAEGRCAIQGIPLDVISSREVERLYLGVGNDE